MAWVCHSEGFLHYASNRSLLKWLAPLVSTISPTMVGASLSGLEDEFDEQDDIANDPMPGEPEPKDCRYPNICAAILC